MSSKTLTEQINEMENKLQSLRSQMKTEMRDRAEEIDKKAGKGLDKARQSLGRGFVKAQSFLKTNKDRAVETGQKMTEEAILKVLEKHLNDGAFRKDPSGSTGGRKRRRTKKKKTKRKKTKKRVKRRKGMTRKSRGRKTRGRKRRR